MVELVPIRADDAIVLNVAKHCRFCRADCRDCCDIGVAVHNWLISTELRYVIIDLQDEKDVCPTFLQEIIQLRKRLRMPFLFAGVMDRPLKVLNDYSYTTALEEIATDQPKPSEASRFGAFKYASCAQLTPLRRNM